MTRYIAPALAGFYLFIGTLPPHRYPTLDAVCYGAALFLSLISIMRLDRDD